VRPIVVHEEVTYKRELRPLQRFDIVTQLVAREGKAATFRHRLVVGDLSARRAQLEDVGFRGALRTVAAKLPLKSLFGYSTAVRSASQGRATFTMRFAKFDAWA
jgi:hypothetical protein